MTDRIFGTDGVRGVANQTLNAELALALGRAGTKLLAGGKERPAILVGRDTRLSGDMLEAALVAGICSAGGEALLLGVVSTPAVAYLTKDAGAAAGVMISASHNPIEDNGIKFFSGDGFKLSDETEDRLAELAFRPLAELGLPVGTGVGRARSAASLMERYLEHAAGLVSGAGASAGDSAGADGRAAAGASGEPLKGLKVVIDCGNGSASAFAPALLRRLGATVWALNDAGDGALINVSSGSTAPDTMAAEVVRRGADLGIAHDGDADRVFLVDEKGRIVDGDGIMAVCGLDLLERGELPKNTVVGTVMSNFGLELALKERGAVLRRAKVGDRYVLETMLRDGYTYGGEQSGHVINLRHNTTGDGVLTALQVIDVMRRRGKPLSELAAVVEKVPQQLLEVPVADKSRLEHSAGVKEAVGRAEAKLNGRGRVLVRASGTQPVIRVMVEGPDGGLVAQVARELADAVDRNMR